MKEDRDKYKALYEEQEGCVNRLSSLKELLAIKAQRCFQLETALKDVVLAFALIAQPGEDIS